MLLRAITSVVGLPLVVGAIWLGSPWLLALAIVAVVVGLWEFARLAQAMGAKPSLVLMAGMGVPLLLNGSWEWGRGGLIVGAGLLAVLAWETLRVLLSRGVQPSEQLTGTLTSAVSSWTFSVAGPIYLGWTIAHGLQIRALPDGREWLLLALVAVFATDTAAFLVGRALGRHAMAPALSPAKTWEGAAGGLVGGVAAAWVLATVLTLPASWWQGLVLGGSIALAAEVGDLAESLLKRAAMVKAPSVLLPGHGGVLDRLDSLVFGVVAGYYLIRWVTL